MKNFLKNKILQFFLAIFFSWFLASCSQVIIGGATSSSMIIVQERSSKQAAIDILIKAKIEEAMFSNNYDKLFSKVRVIVYESKVLLVGTVTEKNMKEIMPVCKQHCGGKVFKKENWIYKDINKAARDV